MGEDQMNAKSGMFETVLEDIVRRVFREEIGRLLGTNHQEKNEVLTESLKPYLNIKEAAEYSRLAPSTIRLYIRQRKLRALKEGRRVIIKTSDLKKFLEANPIEILTD